MIKNSVIFLFLSVFSFLSLAGVRSIYHRGTIVYIEYDAQYEFSADKFLSAVDKEKQKIRQSQPGLINMQIHFIISKPRCKNKDTMCLQYVKEVNRIEQEILSVIDKNNELRRQLRAVVANSKIHINNIAHIENNITREEEWLSYISEIQDFILSIDEDQTKMLSTLQEFQESYPNLEYDSIGAKAWIEQIRIWKNTYHPTDIWIQNFLNKIELIFNADGWSQAQFALQDILTGNINDNQLDALLSFTAEIYSLTANRINSLIDRLDKEGEEISFINTQITDLQKNIHNIWSRIKTQSARRISTHALISFPGGYS